MTHYYDAEQQSDEDPEDNLVSLSTDTFFVTTDNGVFAKDGLDQATELLIESVTPKGRFLDLGCGYGVISVAWLRRHPGIDAVLVDTNKRAVRLARDNLSRYDLDGDVRVSDGYDAVDETFADIVCNPPFAAGKNVWQGFIDEAPTYLAGDGRLSMVARHNKGGRMLMEHMEHVFDNVATVAKSGGYRVYQSTV
mgnify:CR=1 FL=1